MSKITFRADDDLVDAVEDLDASKSEVMRDALRTYLEDAGAASADAASPETTSEGPTADPVAAAIDDAVAERVDELVDRRVGGRRPPERDVNVRITVEAGEGLRAAPDRNADRSRGTRRDRGGDRRPSGSGRRGEPRGGDETSCSQCGESLSDDHVYCPNCGEKATRRVFCECGDEVRADWAFCPHCGRRTASADALDG